MTKIIEKAIISTTFNTGDYMNNIKSLRKRAHLSQLELAEICGVHQTAVSQWEQGRTNPDTDMLIALSEIFHTSIGCILGLDLPNEPLVVPVKGFVTAGNVSMIDDEDVCEFTCLTADNSALSDYFAIRVNGNDMNPFFNDGDLVIFKCTDLAGDNDLIVFSSVKTGAFLRRVKKKDNGTLLLAENSGYDSMFYSPDQMKKLNLKTVGKAVEIRREIG